MIHDAAALRHYAADGASFGARSSDGPMLERAWLFACSHKPCNQCGGDASAGIDGSGWVWGRGSEAKRAAALEHQTAVHEFLRMPPPTDRDLHGDKMCPRCSGRGWYWVNQRHATRPVTARPTGSSRDPWNAGDVDDHETMARFGRVSRRLLAIGNEHAAALLAYHLPSPVAETLAACWALVPAGRALLRGAGEVSPWQAAADVRAAQAARPTADRAALMVQADTQAGALLQAAAEAWGALVDAELDVQAARLLVGAA